MIEIFIIIVILLIFYYSTRSNFRAYPKNLNMRRGLEAAEGRRTITPDIFPDHNLFETSQNNGCMNPNAEGRILAQFANQVNSSNSLTNYLNKEAYAEDFVNTRECKGAVQSEVNTNRLFVLPERWDNIVCEAHCPDHNMIGTRADLGGNLSIDARTTLYDFVPWNVKPDTPDQSTREYIGMQGYSYKENQA